jgi:hypothetical protein
MSLFVPVSLGELLDKIAILQIKSERITDELKLENIRHELSQLISIRNKEIKSVPGLDDLTAALRRVNERLWDIEDAIRVCEKRQDFGREFIQLARAVYQNNDERAALKYQINTLLDSSVIEEKSYQSYGMDD